MQGDKSLPDVLNADVAQLAEHRTCNARVKGSSPFVGFIADIDMVSMFIRARARTYSQSRTIKDRKGCP